jgi:hypothetical protein
MTRIEREVKGFLLEAVLHFRRRELEALHNRRPRTVKLLWNGALVQLETKSLRELPLVKVEGIEAIHSQFEGGRDMQEIRGAGS